MQPLSSHLLSKLQRRGPARTVWENRIPANTKGEEHSHDYDYWLLMGTTDRSPLVYVRQGCGGFGTEIAGNPSDVDAVAYLVELKATAVRVPPPPSLAQRRRRLGQAFRFSPPH